MRSHVRTQALRPLFRHAATQRRSLQIAPTPSSTNPSLDGAPSSPTSLQPSPDAAFEVLGSPYSLLSASVSASQPLYTRRGTLVGFNGRPEQTVSTLSVLEPLRRAVFGIPFLYQKITSTSPYTALVSSNSPVTSFSVVHLDGRVDWMVAQRSALTAWTGHTLSIKPRLNTKMGLAHWGNSQITGRGLVCLAGKGQIYQIALKTGEEYIVHPSNVVGYAMMRQGPQPYRFKSSALRLQVPSVRPFLPTVKFFDSMRQSQTWRAIAQGLFTARTWARRTVWGDRLFLRFEGPANILLQSRGGRMTDSLTTRDVNELADAPAGAVQTIPSPTRSSPAGSDATTPSSQPATTKLSFATVEKDGQVKISDS